MRPPGLTIGGGPRTPEDLPVWRDCEEVPRQKLRYQYDEDHDEHAQCIHSGVRTVGIQHTSYEDDIDEQYPNHYPETSANQKSLLSELRVHEVDHDDRERDADDRVEDCQPERPDPVGIEHPPVNTEVAQIPPSGVEEALDGDAFLENPVCGSQQDDARPSLVPNDGKLSHDENARAIESEQESEVERKEE